MSGCNERRGFLPVAPDWPNARPSGHSEAMIESGFGLSALVHGLSGFNRTGVYFLYKNNVVVYVGQAVDVRRRVADHIGEGSKDFDAVSFVPCTKQQLLAFEAKCIRRLRPRYNRSLNMDAASGLANYGSIVHRKPITALGLGAEDAARYVGLSVIDFARVFVERGYHPRRLSRRRARVYCPIDCAELAQQIIDVAA